MSRGGAHEVVSRCLSLIPLIREHQGIGLEELARLAQVPAEQIAEELGRVLSLCGVPPYFPHDYIGFTLDGGRVRIQFADHFQRPVSLNPLEALALKLACESIAPPGTMPDAVAALLRKVEGAMSEPQCRQFRRLARRLAVGKDRDAPRGVTARVALAVAERRVLLLDYAAGGAGTVTQRRVEPYGLLSREGHWHLVAHDTRRGRTVTFRLDRIRRLGVLDARFEIPAGFRLEEYARRPASDDPEGGPRACIRFLGPSARWIRETVPADAVRGEPDGAVLWTPAVGSEEGLARFVLGFGGDAEVLEPAGLRARVRAALAAVAARHAGGTG